MFRYSGLLLAYGLLLLMWGATSFLVSDTEKQVRKPFRLIWCQASFRCYQKKYNYLFNETEHPEIEINQGMAFYGDKCSTLYASRFGKWPTINRKTHKWNNGGLPQYIDMEAHLASTRKYINRTISHARGFSVLDFEAWYPPFEAIYAGFKKAQLNDTRQLYPNLTTDELKAKAKEIWDKAARRVFEETIRVAKEVRPNRHWGYYHYPRGWPGKNLFLWNISTGMYPSLYVKGNLAKKKLESEEKFQIRLINDSFAKRAVYGNPDTPLMPYALLQRFASSKPKLTGDWLKMAIEGPIEKGVEGLIIWGSDKFFKPYRTTCPIWEKHMKDEVLPVTSRLYAKMTKCSKFLCGENGRCVNKKYVGVIDYLVTRGVPQPRNGFPSQAPPDANNNMELQGFLTNYVCQCYKGWGGDWCAQQYDVN